MQKERTIEFWNEFHEKTGEKEWIVHPTDELFQLICSLFPAPIARGDNDKDSSNKDGILRVLEIGCGTSTMAREFWKYVQVHQENCHFYIRATDVSQVCIDACWERDKDEVDQDPLGQGGLCGLQYAPLNVLNQPEK